MGAIFQDDGEKHYGYYKAEMMGRRLDIKVSRNYPRIEIRFDDFNNTTIFVTELTEKKLKNLIKKLGDTLDAEIASSNLYEKKSAIASKLSEVGIMPERDKYFRVKKTNRFYSNSYQFKLYEDDSFMCIDSFDIREHLSFNQLFDYRMKEIEENFNKWKEKIKQISKVVQDNIELIKEYYSL